MTNTPNYFYTSLIPVSTITIELSYLDMSETEKLELIAIIHSHLHYTILDLVLSNLNTEDKKIFLRHANNIDHQETWKFLNEKIEKAEEKITNAVKDVQNELLKDINDLKITKKAA